MRNGHSVAAEQDVFAVDVQTDPAERHNLASDGAAAQIVSELSARLDRHIAGSVEVPWEYAELPDNSDAAL
jgi:hypothetical protein